MSDELIESPEASPIAEPPEETEGAGASSLGRKELMALVSELMAEQSRLKAEIKNLQERPAENDEFLKFAKQSVQFLDAMDRMIQLGKKHPGSAELANWIQGVESAFGKLLRIMDKFGMEILNFDGQEVDLTSQDVIEYRDTRDYPHNTVIETPLKGVRLRGKILRDAKVVVASNP